MKKISPEWNIEEFMKSQVVHVMGMEHLKTWGSIRQKDKGKENW